MNSKKSFWFVNLSMFDISRVMSPCSSTYKAFFKKHVITWSTSYLEEQVGPIPLNLFITFPSLMVIGVVKLEMRLFANITRSHNRWVPWFIKKFIRKLLTSFMEQYGLLGKHQFGFHKRGNTKQVAALFVDSIRKNINSGKMTCVLTCQKHLTLWFIHKLSQKLSRYCITSIEKELFTDCLFKSKQQFSLLESVMLVFFKNPFGSTLILLIYADDTVIFVTGNSVKEIVSVIWFHAMADWMTANELILDMKKDKTECMLFVTNQKVKEKSLEIPYQDQSINKKTDYKYLGMKLDRTLLLILLNKHIYLPFKKAFGRLYLLSRLRNKLDVKVSMAIYTSHILPLFTNFSITTWKSTNRYKEKLRHMELQAQKVIPKNNDANLPSIESILKKRLCLKIFKVLNKILFKF